MSPQMPPQQQEPRSFRDSTVPWFQPIETISLTENKPTSLVLHKVGLMAQIVLLFRATVTGSTSTKLWNAPWDLIRRITLEFNNGQANVHDASGYGTYLIQPLSTERCYSPDKAGCGDSSPDALFFSTPIADGPNEWIFPLVIPVAMNLGLNMEAGLANLQALQTQATLTIQMGAITDVTASGATVANMTCEVAYQYWEIPPGPVGRIPPLSAIRWVEQQETVVAAGPNDFLVPRGGILTQLIQLLTIDSEPSDAIDSIELEMNRQTKPWRESLPFNKMRYRKMYGLNAPAGVTVHDRFHAQEMVDAGDLRDAIDTAAISDFVSRIYITNGTVLGLTGNNIRYIRRMIQPLAGVIY